MPPIEYFPITDEREVGAFLDRIPLAVDRERFTRFVLGFPHHYLAATSPVEMVKHFALVTSLGRRAAITALAREGALWKLVVVASDRKFLFARIAGSLSFFGANILSAEAFANTEAVVLDIFTLADQRGRFEESEERRRFQAFLEGRSRRSRRGRSPAACPSPRSGTTRSIRPARCCACAGATRSGCSTW